MSRHPLARTPSSVSSGEIRGVAEMPEVPPAAAGAAPPTTCIEAEPFALRVTDDSMEPEFATGCVIIVDPTGVAKDGACLLYTSPSPRDGLLSRMPSSA